MKKNSHHWRAHMKSLETLFHSADVPPHHSALGTPLGFDAP